MTPIPIWVLALVLAMGAPWAARALQLALERRVRRRTLDFLAGVPWPRDRDRGAGRHEADEGADEADEPSAREP